MVNSGKFKIIVQKESKSFKANLYILKYSKYSSALSSKVTKLLGYIYNASL